MGKPVFDELDQKLKEKEQQQRYESEKIDITMPPKKIRYGNLHPVTTVRNQLTDIFASMDLKYTKERRSRQIITTLLH